jgi:hypothetical protein
MTHLEPQERRDICDTIQQTQYLSDLSGWLGAKASKLLTIMDERDARIAELERWLTESECEVEHALWASCGCLSGGGHEEGGPDCPMRGVANTASAHEEKE